MRLSQTGSRRLVPVLAALCVIGLLLGAAVLVLSWRSNVPSTDGGPRALREPARPTPPTLLLTRLPHLAQHSVPPGDESVALGGTSGFRLATSLPSGPATAPAYRLEPQRAGAEQVSGVARALGLAGTSRRSGPGWVVESGGGRLVVLDGAGLPWSYGSAHAGCQPPLPTLDGDSVSSCAALGSGDAPGAAGATASAAAILRKLGAPTNAIRRAGTTFTAPGMVAGRTALGWDTHPHRRPGHRVDQRRRLSVPSGAPRGVPVD